MKPLYTEHVWSWEGHSSVAVLLPAAVLLVFRFLEVLTPTESYWWYVVGVALMAVFYYLRELSDEKVYRAKGTFDKAQAQLTARTDKAGDALGPVTAGATVLTSATMFAGAWWVPLIAVVIGGVYIGYETVRTYRKIKAEEASK